MQFASGLLSPEELDRDILASVKSSEFSMRLVEGNHDRPAGALPVTPGVEHVQEPWRAGLWAQCRHLQEVDGV